MIKENVKAVREKIFASAEKSNRDFNEIKIIGVTKTVTVPIISELLEAGITDVGENRVQDMLPKYEDFQKMENRPKEWHFIGHLQRNKVKFIADKVDLIHSVDSFSLAEEINKNGEKCNKIINILAEINVSGELSKYGMKPNEIFEFVKKLESLRFINLTGLMTVAPFVENSESNRDFFKKMRTILIDINNKCVYHSQLRDLSMGMSLDYEIAIEEGATMVRIGTALFK